MGKKAAAKKAARKQPPARKVKHEVVVRVETAPVIPTVSDLAEPMQDGKKLTIPKTWMGEKQIMRMVQRTPKEHVYRRKGKGGQMFDYVTGSYVTKVLNYVFGWNWDFEIVSHGKEANHVWVMGRLTVHGTKPGETISKTQFGRSEVKMLKTGGMLDYGNDLKAAATDALKKCASMLGIASDIYGKAEYKQETGADVYDRESTAPALPKPKEEATIQIDPDHLVCHGVTKSGCGNDVDEQTAVYSKRVFGKILCRECQQKAKAQDPQSRKE